MATASASSSSGRLVQFGTPREIYEEPANVYVADAARPAAINLLPIDALPGDRRADRRGDRRRAHRARELIRRTNGPAEAVMVEHLGNENHLHLHWRPSARDADAAIRPMASRSARPGIIAPALYFDAAG